MIPATILDAISDPAWWGLWFARGDWTAWRAFLAATFALPMDAEALAIYRECTGRAEPPSAQASEAWAICGRRGGKTRIMATVAAWLAAFVDWRPLLAPGEVATVMLIAANRRQARTAMRYLRSLFVDHPTLAQLIVRETEETLELSCRVVIEVTTASWRSTRGFTVCGIVCDELAFWQDDEGSANPADEILDALRPAMATMPGALLMVATSPYARRGPVWDAHRDHYAKDGDPILVWRAPTRVMNSGVAQSVIDRAMERDPASAAAEFMAEFRSDIEGYITREIVDALVVPGRHELPPVSGVGYFAFTDPSGGSSDSMTLAIAHRDGDRAVLDAIRERRPPFSPEDVVQEFAALLKSYGVREVQGDRYGGEWPRERFREAGITYEIAEKAKSDLYRDALPIMNSHRCELLDHPRLIAQLVGLERRTARGGRDSIDHAPGAHDDIANAAAAVLVRCVGKMSIAQIYAKLAS